uniref:Uncharacterized protein n=1 Tax=Cannabis sativa TaxID=3483 RepID=A0A803PBC8_CANSA
MIHVSQAVSPDFPYSCGELSISWFLADHMTSHLQRIPQFPQVVSPERSEDTFGMPPAPWFASHEVCLVILFLQGQVDFGSYSPRPPLLLLPHVLIQHYAILLPPIDT